MVDAPEFRARYGPWAVVAGGTTGAGEAYSRQLAARGLNVVIIGLESENLDRLSTELPAEHSVEVRAANVDLGSAEILEEMRSLTHDIEVGLLVYNACYLEIGEFLDIDLDSHLKALYVNSRGPLVLSHLLGRQMAERGRGGILLMASLSAIPGTPLLASYAATKAFDITLGEALWEELGHLGVDVLALVAGAMATPNFRRLTPKEKERLLRPVRPEEVAEQALDALGKGPVRIPGALNKVVAFVNLRLLSRRTAVRFNGRNTRKVYAEKVRAAID